MRIMLVRHAETEWNKKNCVQGWSNIGLTCYGVEQAREFGSSLVKDEWDLIISSDLERAVQTAENMVECLDIPMKTMTELRERNYGDLEGMPQDEVKKKYPRLNYLADIPGGESYKSFYKRVICGFQFIENHYDNKRVIIVTHHGVLQILASYLGIVYKWDNLSFIIV